MDNISSQNIRVFISSTFNDMQQERDTLVSKTFPWLRRLAAMKNVTITDIDLRWGITEEESRSSKVIDICLDEIEKSHPFFIGILGSRYGWTPCVEETDWATVISPNHDWAIDDISKGMSMTEMEIQYGVLRSNKKIHCFFYIKDCDEEAIDPRQKALRTLVDGQKLYPVRHYKTAEELNKMVLTDFRDKLVALFPDVDNKGWQAYRRKQTGLLESMTRYFVAPQATADELYDYVRNGEEKGLLLTSTSGSGKSTLLAHTALQLLNAGDADTAFVFASALGTNMMFDDAASQLCYQLSELYGLQYDGSKPGIDQLRLMAPDIRPEKPLIIIIDGINQLVAEGREGNLTWWPEWNDGVKTVFSSLEESAIVNEIDPSWRRLAMRPLDLEQRMTLVEKYFADYRKSLSMTQIEPLTRKLPLLDNTLILTSLIDEIRRYGNYEHLLAHIESLLDSGDPTQFLCRLIERYREFFDQDGEAVGKVLSLIALSERGLDEHILVEVSGESRMTVSQILNLCGNHIVTRQGKVLFAHDLFDKAVHLTFLTDKSTESDYRHLIIDFFKNNPKEQGAIEEIAYQFCRCGMYDELYCLIGTKNTFSEFRKAKRLHTLANYWQTLISSDPYSYDILSYVFNDEKAGLPDGWSGKRIPSFDAFDSFMTDTFEKMSSSDLLIELSRTLLLHIHNSKASRRLLYALITMIENEDESYDEIRNNALNSIAVSYIQERQWGDALTTLNNQLRNGHAQIDSPEVLNIGEVFLRMYEADGDEKMLDNALTIDKAVLDNRIGRNGELDADVAVAYANYASAISYRDKEEGVRLHKKSLDIYRAVAGNNNPDVAIQHHNMSTLLADQDIDESLRHAEKALEIYRNIAQGTVSEDIAEELIWIGAIHMHLDNYQEAFECMKEVASCIDRFPRLLSKRFSSLDTLCNAAIGAGEYDTALETVERMEQTAESEEQTVRAFSYKGGILTRMNDDEAASENYLKAIATAQAAGMNEEEIKNRCHLSRSYWKRGLFDEAGEQLSLVAEMSEQLGMERSNEYTFALFNRALLNVNRRNNIPQAIADIEKAIELRSSFAGDDDDQLEEYHSQLEKIRQVYGDDGTDMPDSEEVDMKEADEMDGYLADDSDTADTFREGLMLFKQGNPESAKSCFMHCKERLDGSVNHSALAMVYRFIAYSDEMVLKHFPTRGIKKESIVEMYNKAAEESLSAQNRILACDIFLDIAEFYWGQEDYEMAEKDYWIAIMQNIQADRFTHCTTAQILSNIISAISKQNKLVDSRQMAAMHATAAQISYITGYDEELENRSLAHMQVYLTHSGVDMDSYQINPVVEEMHIGEYLMKDNYAPFIAEEFINMAYEICGKEDWETRRRLFRDYVVIQYLLQEYHYALGSARQYLESWDDDSSDSRTVRETVVSAYVSLHDIDMALKTASEFGIDQEFISNLNSKLLPCSAVLQQGDNATADSLYEELSAKETLTEAQLYDATLFCIAKGMKYEALRHFDDWEKRLQLFRDEDVELFKTAHQLLKGKTGSIMNTTH